MSHIVVSAQHGTTGAALGKSVKGAADELIGKATEVVGVVTGKEVGDALVET